jgi:hypothetical protein
MSTPDSTVANMMREIEKLRAKKADLVLALQKIDSNAAESVEWIRRVAREALAKAGAR